MESGALDATSEVFSPTPVDRLGFFFSLLEDRAFLVRQIGQELVLVLGRREHKLDEVPSVGQGSFSSLEADRFHALAPIVLEVWGYQGGALELPPTRRYLGTAYLAAAVASAVSASVVSQSSEADRAVAGDTWQRSAH